MATWLVDHLDHDFSVMHTFAPENLSFNQRINDISDINYEISRTALDISGDPVWPLILSQTSVAGQGIGEYRSGYRLRRDEQIIQEGLITSRGGNWGDDHMAIGGKQYAHYLERRMFPFDPRPDHVNDWLIATGNDSGVTYMVSAADPATILMDIFNLMFPMLYSMPMAYFLVYTGYTTDYQLSLGDTTTLKDIIDGLAQQEPGFDWEMGNDGFFQNYAPKKYGTPGGIVADPSSVIWTFDDTDWDGINDTITCPNGCTGISFVSTGPGGTRILGLGAGLSTQIGKGIGYENAQQQFWLLEDSRQYGNITGRAQINSLTQSDLSLDVNPIHEISVDLNPNAMDNFWTTFYAGLAIYLKCHLGWHTIDSPHQIMEMACTVSNQGDEHVTLKTNQIYDTTGLTGADGYFGGRPGF